MHGEEPLLLQLCHGEAVACTGGAGSETVGIHHGAVGLGVHGPGELRERYGLAIEVGTVAEEQGRIEIDGGVYLAREGIVGADVAGDLDHEVVEVSFVGEDYSVGVVACHRVRA